MGKTKIQQIATFIKAKTAPSLDLDPREVCFWSSSWIQTLESSIALHSIPTSKCGGVSQLNF